MAEFDKCRQARYAKHRDCGQKKDGFIYHEVRPDKPSANHDRDAHHDIARRIELRAYFGLLLEAPRKKPIQHIAGQ